MVILLSGMSPMSSYLVRKNQAYSLIESANLLEQLRDFVETDKGIWDQLEPIEALSCQSAYTYGNAVMCKLQKLIDYLNESVIDEILGFDNEEEDLDEAIGIMFDEWYKKIDK